MDQGVIGNVVGKLLAGYSMKINNRVLLGIIAAFPLTIFPCAMVFGQAAQSWTIPQTLLNEFSFQAAEDHAITTVTASFTYDATMHNVVAGSLSTALTAAVTAALPACVAVTKGRTYGLKKVDTSSFAVTLTPNGTDKIDGGANVALSAQFAQANVQCDGAGNWWRGFY